MWSHIFLFGSLPTRRPPEFTAILMFEFWREATATSLPGFLCQSGRRRPENVSILSSLTKLLKHPIGPRSWQYGPTTLVPRPRANISQYGSTRLGK